MSSILNCGTTKTFQIPIDHLDYKFIENCTDVKHLEKILTVLRSGEEGCFPDLTEYCEKRLESLNPESRALRKDKPVATPANFLSDEWQKIHEDVENWLADIAMKEKTITFQKTENAFQERLENVPPVRGHKNRSSNLKNKTSEKKQGLKKKTPRDYRDWEKFDVEKECSKVDIPERKSTQAIINSKMPKIEKRIDTAGSSEIEKSYIANHEKEKGNEAFRSGDYEEAVTYYTRSISAQPTATAYNNRAQAEIKRQNWQNALNDCEKVLDLEPGNVKALLRRATVDKHLNNYQRAEEDLKRVLEEEPANATAQTLLSEIEKKITLEPINHRKGKRIPIQEIEGSDECNDDEDGAQAAAAAEAAAAAAAGAETAAAAAAAQAAASTQHTDDMGNAQKKFGEPAAQVYRAREEGESGGGGRKESSSSPGKGRRGSRQPEPDRTGAHKSGSAAPPAANGPTSALRQQQQPPSTADLKGQGNELFKHGQFAEAAAKYSEAIGTLQSQEGTSTPEELSILYSNRAACYLKDGNLSNCIDDCSRALELEPFSLKPLLRRALACESMERYREAYVDYKTVLQIDNGIQSANDSINRITRLLMDQDGIHWRENLPPIPAVPVSLQSHRWTGNSDSSEDKQASQRSSKKAEQMFLSLKQEGNAYVKKAQYKQALEKYSACLKINSEECSIYTNRALCYLKLGQFDEARQDCDRAIQLDATSVKAFYRRALAHKGLQNYEASMNDLNKVLQMDPNVSEARKELEEVAQSLKSLTNSMENNHEKQRKKIQIEEPVT